MDWFDSWLDRADKIASVVSACAGLVACFLGVLTYRLSLLTFRIAIGDYKGLRGAELLADRGRVRVHKAWRRVVVRPLVLILLVTGFSLAGTEFCGKDLGVGVVPCTAAMMYG